VSASGADREDRDKAFDVRSLTVAEWRHWMTDGVAHAGIPAVPPEQLQKRFNAFAGRANLEAAWRYYQTIRTAAATHGVPVAPATRIAEFGCGWGRVLRCFLHDVPASNLTGFDVLHLAVQQAREQVPGATIVPNKLTPPTTFEDDCFDLLYAVSVFSHLPEDLHLQWVAEIARIVRPGGVVVLSTLPRQRIEQLPWWHEGSMADYDRGEFVYEPHPRPQYGLAAIPESYVRREWSRWLSLREFRPEYASQALIIGVV
jgi:SAM-dependent methyltransferase